MAKPRRRKFKVLLKNRTTGEKKAVAIKGKRSIAYVKARLNSLGGSWDTLLILADGAYFYYTYMDDYHDLKQRVRSNNLTTI